ncbi:hypothetical protein [Flavobacterium sp.]|uniref:hypothetical protein n=1 Tax=Flavobacterium sp. TaxID=239 RepID=UPI002620ECC4|nr:hypothetical protein [Flavobacterium sp.]
MLNLLSFFSAKYPEYVQVPLEKIPGNEGYVKIQGNNQPVTLFNVLYEPQLIGLTFSDNNFTSTEIEGVSNLSLGENAIFLKISFESTIKIPSGNTFLYRVNNADLDIQFWKRKYLQRFYKRAVAKNNFVIEVFDFGVFLKITSFFYYPKPVFLVSTKEKEGRNTFPVDTCRKVGNYYIFGARKSNRIINKAVVGDEIVIGSSDFTQRELIYQLGKYSSGKNEIPSSADGQTGIFVPSTVASYEVAEIHQIIAYKNQNVYIAKVTSGIMKLSDNPMLAHIHKFWLIEGKIRSRYRL